VQLARRSQRNRRPAAQQRPGAQQQNGARQNGNGASSASPDRYEKYLPAWMKGTNGAPPPRPRGPRRPRQQRPAGGYTPGKFATNNGDLLS
jgi:hypothetical protein